MNFNLKTTYYFILFLFFGLINAQERNEITIDSSEISVKQFSSSIPEKYANKKFDYSVETGQSQNYLLRAIEWFFEKLGAIFGIDVDPGLYKTIEILIYVILIIIAVYIITKLFLNTQTSSFFGKQSKDLAPIISFEEDHIEQINLDELINNALLQPDYRLAIRYMYLKALKNLSLKNLINWHFDKTNYDYQNELKTLQLKQYFSSVSYLYDHIWYGEFGLDEESFKKAKNQFDQLNKAINSNG